jgi:hypothetical protein
MSDGQIYATITNRRIALAAANVSDQTTDALRRWRGDYSEVIRVIAENELARRVIVNPVPGGAE